jgi:predicted DNA-binding WGR domain protein
MCVLLLPTAFFWKTSHAKKNSARYYHKCTQVFMWSTRYSCQVLMKPEFSRQIFEKYSNTKFHENPSGGSPVVTWGRAGGRTDGQTGTKKLTVAFRNSANARKNCYYVKEHCVSIAQMMCLCTGK